MQRKLRKPNRQTGAWCRGGPNFRPGPAMVTCQPWAEFGFHATSRGEPRQDFIGIFILEDGIWPFELGSVGPGLWPTRTAGGAKNGAAQGQAGPRLWPQRSPACCTDGTSRRNWSAQKERAYQFVAAFGDSPLWSPLTWHSERFSSLHSGVFQWTPVSLSGGSSYDLLTLLIQPKLPLWKINQPRGSWVYSISPPAREEAGGESRHALLCPDVAWSSTAISSGSQGLVRVALGGFPVSQVGRMQGRPCGRSPIVLSCF